MLHIRNRNLQPGVQRPVASTRSRVCVIWHSTNLHTGLLHTLEYGFPYKHYIWNIHPGQHAVRARIPRLPNQAKQKRRRLQKPAVFSRQPNHSAGRTGKHDNQERTHQKQQFQRKVLNGIHCKTILHIDHAVSTTATQWNIFYFVLRSQFFPRL